MGIECRSDDAELQALLAPLGCSVTTACVSAERRVSARLGGNCSVPLAAYCVEEGDGYWLQALVADPSGAPVLRAEGRGPDPSLWAMRLPRPFSMLARGRCSRRCLPPSPNAPRSAGPR